LSPSISNQQAPGNLESHPRRDGKRTRVPGSIPEHSTTQPSWLPPSHASPHKAVSQIGASEASATAEPVSLASAANDEGFSRFYNTFESILTRLSAPLAFAGLPLVSDEAKSVPQPEPASQLVRRTSNSKETTSQEPDLSRYISRAALRATARDGNSANDSFYVVPTAGHSVSYAQILSFDQKERRRMASSIHSEHPQHLADFEDDDFVDARETPMPQSPNFPRKASHTRQSSKQLENRIEELNVENQSLKDIVDKLSKRLSAFEMSAQDNGLKLQQSMRMIRTASPGRNLSPGPADEALKRRISELEERESLKDKEIERLGRDNEKQKHYLARYRDRWEKLKEGAKTRREGSSSNTRDTLPKRETDPTGGRFIAG
jgi:uncharacterized coiled-coil protein SlyX